MSFLPEAQLPCEACDGLRYDPETLAVRLYGVNIGELSNMHVDEVCALFAAVPAVHGPLQLMCELGLGYLTLGQPSNTLSGGEAQRLKLVSELSGNAAGPTLYVMDEPTTGSAPRGRRAAARGDRQARRARRHRARDRASPGCDRARDWVVDLGPEGGEGGGRIVAQGTPEQIMRVRASHTGLALKRELHAAHEGREVSKAPPRKHT